MSAAKSVKAMLPTPVRRLLTRLRRRLERAPVTGHAAFGDLRRLTPVSREFGCDRGLSLARHYIEGILERQCADGGGGLLEIGAHTRTNPLLLAHTSELQEEGIAGSNGEAEALAGRPVTGFSFSYRPETVRLVAATGFARACASIHAQVCPDSDRFLLPRMVVGDWNGATFEQRLQAEFLP